MKRHRTETRIAPSAWSGYLINGDYTGMAYVEIQNCKAWLEMMGFGFPVSCEDAGFHRTHDATPFMDYPCAADCQEYLFITPEVEE